MVLWVGVCSFGLSEVSFSVCGVGLCSVCRSTFVVSVGFGCVELCTLCQSELHVLIMSANLEAASISVHEDAARLKITVDVDCDVGIGKFVLASSAFVPSHMCH